jgi:hypothetical protein
VCNSTIGNITRSSLEDTYKQIEQDLQYAEAETVLAGVIGSNQYALLPNFGNGASTWALGNYNFFIRPEKMY